MEASKPRRHSARGENLRTDASYAWRALGKVKVMAILSEHAGNAAASSINHVWLSGAERNISSNWSRSLGRHLHTLSLEVALVADPTKGMNGQSDG
mmetsp:Transcript_45489/g.83256  ORF Transcript_45489/g.83256 Transcript_45489/m.83256 type:complete len:96 (+) Transcript_45489:353-640(+)